MATTSDPMRWRGSSAEHVCWRRSAVRWARGHTGAFRRTPASTPSPSEPSPSLYLRPLGRYSSGARGATAMQASALEASVNELIDTIFGCYPSSKSAGVVPKGVPTIWHKSTARHLAHALNPFAALVVYIRPRIYFPLNGSVGYIYLNFIYF